MTLDSPIIIGLCGKAGTGKTTTADGIVPSLVTRMDDEFMIRWDHTYFALPLYEMASIKRMTQGEHAKDRIKYALHALLSDLLGGSPLYGAPAYTDLVMMVEEIANMPISMDTQIKPRKFLQDVGAMCRAHNPDCFVNYTLRKINQRWSARTDEESDYAFITIVSDVRMENEAAAIASRPNSMVLKLEASYEKRMERMVKRDGVLPDPSLFSHATEQVDDINPEYISATIDTEMLSLKEQIQTVQNRILLDRGLAHA